MQFMADMINIVKCGPNGMGVFYWAPESPMRDGMWKQGCQPGCCNFGDGTHGSVDAAWGSHVPEVPPK